MWILASRGPCTITKIVENDGYSQTKNRKKTRWDIYNRIITGEQDSVINMIEKRLVYEFDKIITSKPTSRYSLSHMGAFYAIQLFPEKWLTFDKIIASHKHLLPLIFDKWDATKEYSREKKSILYYLSKKEMPERSFPIP